MQSVADKRGTLTELFKFPSDGQVFCLRMPAGAVRGEHYHLRKTENFCVIDGDAVISIRSKATNLLRSYFVSGSEPEVRTIPPGNVHNIEAKTNCICLVWVDEQFNESDPDTYAEEV